MDQERFQAAVQTIRGQGRQRAGIGTLGEKSVHAVLKEYYSFGDGKEVRIGGFVADIVGEDGIIEIQTRQVGRLYKKLSELLPLCRVTVVVPVVTKNTIQWISPQTGELLDRRTSPKKQKALDGAAELYGIKPLLKNEGLTVRLILIETEEIRLRTEAKRGRAKAKEKIDRLPVRAEDEIVLRVPEDYRELLPEGLVEFTSKDLSAAAHISLSTAQTVLNIMSFVGAVEVIGKKGRSNLYRKG
ncbi:MAG: hypothetical protein IJ806_10565 [Ruminococcus sp.]|nr:hypothetical protein [Ruminococcus sp.]